MTPEEAIQRAIADTARAIADKIRSCASDAAFLKHGQQMIEAALTPDVNVIQAAMRVAFIQAAKFAEEMPSRILLTIVTKDKERPA